MGLMRPSNSRSAIGLQRLTLAKASAGCPTDQAVFFEPKKKPQKDCFFKKDFIFASLLKKA